jgi:hypothetical protein
MFLYMRKMQKIGILLSSLIMVFELSISVQATLMDMNDGTIYDTSTQLSWLKDAEAGGVRTKDEAIAWVESLNAGRGFAGLTGWRLPAADPACGMHYNCTRSEMGHLYYTELGNVAGRPLANVGPFTNLQRPLFYWTGNEYALSTQETWVFSFITGVQTINWNDDPCATWAVRMGER